MSALCDQSLELVPQTATNVADRKYIVPVGRRMVRMRVDKRRSGTRRTVVQQNVRESGRRHPTHVAAEHASFERVSPSGRDDEDVGGDRARAREGIS